MCRISWRCDVGLQAESSAVGKCICQWLRRSCVERTLIGLPLTLKNAGLIQSSSGPGDVIIASYLFIEFCLFCLWVLLLNISNFISIVVYHIAGMLSRNAEVLVGPVCCPTLTVSCWWRCVQVMCRRVVGRKKPSAACKQWHHQWRQAWYEPCLYSIDMCIRLVCIWYTTDIRSLMVPLCAEWWGDMDNWATTSLGLCPSMKAVRWTTATQCWLVFQSHYCIGCSQSWTPQLGWCSQGGSQST